MTTFTIPGKPQGKARARTVYNKYNNKTHSYTPGHTVSYEKYLQETDQRKYDQVPLKVTIRAYFEPVKSTSKKNKFLMYQGDILPTKKPDADNIAKVICDALNGIAYQDDTQICDLRVTKEYSEKQRVEVTIEPLRK